MKWRATSPPIECPMITSFAFALPDDCAPVGEPLLRLRRELPRRDPVVAPPVVRELEQVLARLHVEALLEVADQLGVAVDLPDARQEVDVADHRRRRDPVDVVLVDRVVLELQVADAAPERAQGVQDGPARDVPDVAVALPEDAPGDAGNADDDVAHQIGRRHEMSFRRRLGRLGGNARRRAPSRRLSPSSGLRSRATLTASRRRVTFVTIALRHGEAP